MVISFENPVAEEILAALRAIKVPDTEIARIGTLIPTPDQEESTQWSEEDFHDLDRDTARLIDERFGPEEGNYD